jgi:tetratricopeptide (TPR) repeat protein
VFLTALLLLAAGPDAAGPMAGDRSRYAACLALTKSAPERAIDSAQAWRIEGGGVPARHCLALAQFAAKDYPAALKSFEGAALQSESARDGEAVPLWRQAADAAMLADQPGEAVRFLDRALAPGVSELSPRAEAALRLTRAEALVDLKREPEAAADLATVTARDPANADGWLLQATLARRMGDLPLAERAILAAAERRPDDAAVQYEAGNIAAAQGRTELARTAWTAAARMEPESIPGKAAAKALAQ